MAVFLVAARDLPTGYSHGDPITVQADGHVWGLAETLPDFYIVNVPSVDLMLGREKVAELETLALPGDPEFDGVETVFIYRHRRKTRLAVDALPKRKRKDLAETGITTLNYAQARAAYKHLVWNKTLDTVEEAGEVLP